MKLKNFWMIIFFSLLLSLFVKGEELPKLPVVRQNKDFIFHYDRLTYDELAKLIVSGEIYKVENWGTGATASNVRNTLHGFYYFCDKKFYKQIREEYWKLIEQYRKNEKTARLTFAIERKKIATDIIAIRAFFVNAIDEDCLSKNPFFVDIEHVAIELEEPLWRLQLDHTERHRFLEIAMEKIHKKISEKGKLELEGYRDRMSQLEKKKDENLITEAEYHMQNCLRDQQQGTLKESLEYMVGLYSVEPRADGELLELFSRSQYPEVEKVKILMELNIPYKNYRTWESDRRKFKTNAKFISIDNRSRVTLEKPDGKQTTIDLHRLRAADRTYVREQTKQTTTQPETESKNN
jgi:hypothetical protein